MTKAWMIAGAAALALGACGKNDDSPAPTSEAAGAAAGAKTLATGLGDNKTFGAAVKAAGLDAVLAGPTPYTLLVPSDAAFAKLPAGALDALMTPEQRKELTALLTHHILAGTILSTDIAKAIEAGNGTTQLPTLGGGTLTASREGEQIVITDASGHRAAVVSPDGQRSNGVIHGIDAVLTPGK